MRKTRYIMLLAFIAAVFLLTSCTPLQNTGQNKAPSSLDSAEKKSENPVWPHENSDLKPDPALIFKSLPNGFRYVLMKNTTPQNRVSMHLVAQAGSVHETDEEQGLAHFLEHMQFNGSEHFQPGELVKYFQNIGMDFGPDANAHTGFFSTGYDILLPSGDEKSLADGLMVMQDYAQSALLPASEIERERKIILAEKRARDSASYRTFVSSFEFELPESIISKRLPIGQEETIQKADRERLKHFYDTWYRPEKMFLVLAGDFEPETAASLIEERFKTLSPRAPPKPEPDMGDIRHEGIKAFYHYENAAGNTQLTIEVIEKIELEKDSLEFQKKYLIRNIASQIMQNRLDSLTRKPDTPFTAASSGSGIYMKHIEYGAISAESSPEKWKESLYVLEQNLRKALNFGFTKSELERVKSDYLAGLDNAVKNAGTRESAMLARQIIKSLETERVFQSPEQEKEIYEPLIRSLSLKDVNKAFQDIWSPEHRLIMVTGNADLNNREMKPEEIILGEFNKSSQTAVSAPDDLVEAVFPYLPEPENTGKIVFQNEISDLGIIQIDFKNNFRLNLKKTDFKDNEVIACLNFGPGRAGETKPGLTVLSEAVINESGLGELDRDELNRALAGKNTSVIFSITHENFSFKGQSVSNESELLFQLLYAHITDPGFREDAYVLSMERFNQGYQEMERTIDGAMILYGQQFLAGGDTRFGIPAYEDFKKMSLEHVREWLGEYMENAPLELSIVGDFDTEKIISLASRYFGSLKPRSLDFTKTSSELPRFPQGQSLNINVNTEIPKGEARIAYPSEDIWDISRTRRIATLASIFSDRLREVIREKLGATYSPYAYNAPSRAYKGYGVFQAVISISPDEADAVVNETMSIISDIAEKGVTQDELKRALAPTLTGIKDLKRKNAYWLNTVLAGSKEHPEQIEWSRSILEDYASITAGELEAMAEKYLDNEKAAVIIIKPDPAYIKKEMKKEN